MKKTSLKFDYGKIGLKIKLNPSWHSTIIKPSSQKVLVNPIKAIRLAIRNPLGSKPLKEIIKSKNELKSACIVVSDATRPVPSHLILDALHRELETCGLKRENITILIATGLHRPSTATEIERIVGKKYFNVLNVVNHSAKDSNSLKIVENYQGTDRIAINKHYLESDLKILTGYVEPHFFFGFSGGSKSIVPGIASKETIMLNHSAARIASPHARFGSYLNNPMAILSNQIAETVRVDFTVNVCINQKHQITKVSAGEMKQVHEDLVNFQLSHVFKPISGTFDIVVCGNGGYPLDLNLYQAVKSMAIGEIAVKEGGTIIAVNECCDGIGIGQDEFRNLLFSKMSTKEIDTKILNGAIKVPDQWEIQVLVRILQKAAIYLVSELKKEQLGNIGLKHATDVETAIDEALNKHGADAKILFLPNGPQVVPKLIS